MEYRIMAKGKYDKKFQCYGTHHESKYVEPAAQSLVKSLWAKEVKVICTDDNGVSEEIWYKKED